MGEIILVRAISPDTVPVFWELSCHAAFDTRPPFKVDDLAVLVQTAPAAPDHTI